MKSNTVNVAVAAAPERVYAFASDPRNMPRWATAFVQSVREEDGEWFVETPVGPLKFRFYPQNACGVLDHTVTMPDGREVLNPMRVFADGAGSEVAFTVFQQPDQTDAEFAADVDMIERDLQTLRDVIEG